MNDRDRADERPNVIEGADAAALGTTEAPEAAPPGATVDASERLVPGADADARLLENPAKPWSTSLAADHPTAGVGNELDRETDPLLEDGARD